MTARDFKLREEKDLAAAQSTKLFLFLGPGLVNGAAKLS